MFLKEKAAGEVRLSPDAKIFLKAAEEIEARGLCQRRVEDPTGRICTAHAIAIGAHLAPSWRTFSKEFDRLARMFERVAGESVCIWNNEPGRTADQASAMLRRIASRV